MSVVYVIYDTMVLMDPPVRAAFRMVLNVPRILLVAV
jgi:hypothetical protein